MKNKVIAVVSWIMALWMCKVFLSSLPYKFTGHPDTQHIFGTIGEWMKGIIGDGAGGLFVSHGAYLVGTFELTTSIVLLLPAVVWLVSLMGISGRQGVRSRFHMIGGAMAAVVMAGAAFFHLVTSLGIEVLHQGKSDGGSLFYAAVSILVFGVIMFFMNASIRK